MQGPIIDKLWSVGHSRLKRMEKIEHGFLKGGVVGGRTRGSRFHASVKVMVFGRTKVGKVFDHYLQKRLSSLLGTKP